MPSVKVMPRLFVLAGLIAAALICVVCTSRVSSADKAHETSGRVAIDDWTYHHLVFSNPGTLEEAQSKGQIDRWLRIVSDPRYKLQQSKRQAAASGSFQLPRYEFEPKATKEVDTAPMVDPFARVPSSQLPRGLVRVSPDASVEGGNLPKRRRSRRFHVAGTLQTDWSEDLGSGATTGLGMFPAKFSFDVSSATCGNAAKPDFVVYNTGLAGSATQADIIAYDNLYSGCSGTVPETYWAYNTGGAVTTSVVLSLDGSQIAFVQSASGAASLVVLKWAASTSETAGSPMLLTTTSASSYRNCTAPCMTVIPFSGAADDTASSPFYDYSSDTLYVGDDQGTLHKFAGVFAGTPSEVSGSGWPAPVSTQPLGGPIYDGVSGNIFVGDYLPLSLSGSSTCAMSGCGFLYSVNASTGVTVGKSSQLDYQFGIVDSPLVDSSAQRVYAFAGADGSSVCSSSQQCAGVFQFPTTFASGKGTEATVGAGFDFLMSGSFDNAYFTSSNGSSPSGHLYVVGDTGLANNTLFQIAINSNVMSTSAVSGPQIANNFDNSYESPGLPITEIANGTHDYLFVSALYFGLPTNCNDNQGNGCVLVYDVASGTIDSGTTPLIATAEAGGTSGIVIDNTSTFPGASQIYFTTLANQNCPTSGGTGGCAIQTSQ